MSYKIKSMIPLERGIIDLNDAKEVLLEDVKFKVIKHKYRIKKMKELEPQIKSAKNLDDIRELSKKCEEIENTVI